MNEEQLDDLLKDVKIDKERVKKSVYTVLKMYGLKPSDVFIIREELHPSEIYVAAIEECNVEDAKMAMKQKYQNLFPAPITVLEFRKKHILFMGSNRSIIFILKGKLPDCIIVKLPNKMEEPRIISEASHTLQEIIKKQK
ncbi:hypothetical protein HYU07_00360 [Candidatus Woesearchaeota archaeon]|nr:hypothetical protein [Candidatus Woesearchaeota archaeon]